MLRKMPAQSICYSTCVYVFQMPLQSICYSMCVCVFQIPPAKYLPLHVRVCVINSLQIIWYSTCVFAVQIPTLCIVAYVLVRFSVVGSSALWMHVRLVSVLRTAMVAPSRSCLRRGLCMNVRVCPRKVLWPTAMVVLSSVRRCRWMCVRVRPCVCGYIASCVVSSHRVWSHRIVCGLIASCVVCRRRLT